MDKAQWFALRDLKRRNSKTPAYKMFAELGMEYFTPMMRQVKTVGGRRQYVEEPYMPDLLFVKDTKRHLDPIIEKTPKLQYRYKYGVKLTPLTVPATDMERFIKAVSSDANTKYYSPDQLTPAMLNRKIRIVGGILDGYEGTLVTMRGSKVKRLLVTLPSMLAAAVEVQPDYIALL